MAEGFAKAAIANGSTGECDIEVRSAGTAAAGIVNRDTIDVMAEVEIDITTHTSDLLNDEMLEWADVVVTMGCCSADELCPVGFKGKKIDWDIDDPLGKPWEFFQKVRDYIEILVKDLIEGETERRLRQKSRQSKA